MSIIINQYKKLLVHRYDDDHIVKYLSYKDFNGLKCEEISFKTKEENVIKGAFYFYEGFNEEELVILCHGLGGGHTSYMREIEFLCKKKYRVLSYDNTGCFNSSGKDIRGFSESLNCLSSVLSFIENHDCLKKLKLHIIGHSWGGFTASNIYAFHSKNIYSICAISPFISIEVILNDFMKGKFKFVQRKCLKYEKQVNEKYALSSALNALKDTKANVLIIHSKDDPIVPFETNTKVLMNNINNKNVKFLIVDNKGHNPNYKKEASKYMNETFATYNKLIKEKKLSSFEDKKRYMEEKDLFKMTEQDEEIWEEIINNMK